MISWQMRLCLNWQWKTSKRQQTSAKRIGSNFLKDEQKITYPLYDLELDTGEVISPMIYSETEWNTKYRITPFYQNVMREGRLL
jgi:hypothetical protein